MTVKQNCVCRRVRALSHLRCCNVVAPSNVRIHSNWIHRVNSAPWRLHKYKLALKQWTRHQLLSLMIASYSDQNNLQKPDLDCNLLFYDSNITCCGAHTRRLPSTEHDIIVPSQPSQSADTWEECPWRVCISGLWDPDDHQTLVVLSELPLKRNPPSSAMEPVKFEYGSLFLEGSKHKTDDPWFPMFGVGLSSSCLFWGTVFEIVKQ